MFKRFIEEKKVIVFDLDGTLVDTTPYWIQALEEVADNLGVDDVYIPNIFEKGTTLEKLWGDILSTSFKKPEIAVSEIIKSTYTKYVEIINTSDIEPTNGFWELAYELKEKKGLKLVLATNALRIVTNAVLKKLNINKTFDFIICGDEVKKVKPDPEIYLAIAKQFNVTPEEVSVFEDSIAGSEASTKAGMLTTIVWDQETPKEDYPKGIYTFIPDFETMVGNFEYEYEERVKEEVRKTEKEAEEENKLNSNKN